MDWRWRIDGPGRPVRIQAGSGNTALWQAVTDQGLDGAYEALGCIPHVKSNGGSVDTFRNYGAYSAQLLSHAVKLGGTSACDGTGVCLYGVGPILYLGTKMSQFSDVGTQTAYGLAYDAAGRLTA